MKSGKAALAVTAAAVSLIVLASCIQLQKPVPAEEAWARFVGTWENPGYSGQGPLDPKLQKLVIRADFTGEDWAQAVDARPTWSWRVANVIKSWTDWRGRTYCQYYGRCPGYQGYAGLLRVSRSGRVLELNAGVSGETGTFPQEIDPRATLEGSSYYFIYYRE